MLDVTLNVERINKKLKDSTNTLTKRQARYLVDSYYQVQKYRTRASNQLKAVQDDEPHEIINWMFENNKKFENQIKNVLNAYTDQLEIGRWAKSIVGIGPVISAGLIAHIDIAIAPTVGHIWRFAGIDPTIEWGKNQKRPYNQKLKDLCWKIGQSFVKVSNNENDVYGKIYKERKIYENEKNEKGDYKEQAAEKLRRYNIDKSTKAYKCYTEGILPPAHIDQRCQRYAVKIFLSHFHHVWYEIHFKEKPPKPFAIEHLGHAHYIKPPNWD